MKYFECDDEQMKLVYAEEYTTVTPSGRTFLGLLQDSERLWVPLIRVDVRANTVKSSGRDNSEVEEIYSDEEYEDMEARMSIVHSSEYTGITPSSIFGLPLRPHLEELIIVDPRPWFERERQRRREVNTAFARFQVCYSIKLSAGLI